jgi:hypothetical protein
MFNDGAAGANVNTVNESGANESVNWAEAEG